MQGMRQRQRNAFTLGEMLVAVSLLALMATMLIPLVSDKTGESKLITATKDAAAQIANAYTVFQKNSVPNNNTTPVAIINNLNYVRIVNDGSLNIQINGTNYACDVNFPCALLHNGALVRYDTNARFGETPDVNDVQLSCWLCDLPTAAFGDPVPHPNINALTFYVDPDGQGPEDAVHMVLFFSGRITTRFLAPEANFYDENQPNDSVDPEYLWDWVRG